MKKRARPDPKLLKHRAAQSLRRKMANDFARDVRLGEIRLNGWDIFEIPDQRPCFECDIKGRVWMVSQWRPNPALPHTGAFVQKPPLCVVCCLQRMTPAKGAAA
jgi:hypothetical protein